MNYLIEKTAGYFVELLYPQKCPACDKVLAKNEKQIGFCKKCSDKIKIVGKSSCMRCGKPLTDETQEYCKDCIRYSHEFIGHKGVYIYSGAMKPTMYKFKYSNRRCYGKTFARQAILSYGEWLKSLGIEMIIPVPMYEKKQRRRGYNQANVFAKALSKETGIPTNDRIVRRIRNTAPMKELNNTERVKNLRTAFKLSETGVQFRKVLLVDDIYTTGSTMDAVAQVLKAGGIESVYGMSVCIGESD